MFIILLCNTSLFLLPPPHCHSFVISLPLSRLWGVARKPCGIVTQEDSSGFWNSSASAAPFLHRSDLSASRPSLLPFAARRCALRSCNEEAIAFYWLKKNRLFRQLRCGVAVRRDSLLFSSFLAFGVSGRVGVVGLRRDFGLIRVFIKFFDLYCLFLCVVFSFFFCGGRRDKRK